MSHIAPAARQEADLRVHGGERGTRLVVTTDVRPKGPATVLSPLLRLCLRRELAKKYQTVEQVCEGESDLSSG